ncbi:hypothetical protein FZD47_24005 [Bacillus infantis]|uniref:Uncharacterized protein n=1 Tax=Bacillus infantis TaxID=324767 RepID=A0A5D4S2N9_9BACI|nr:hypothetical protein [Bacillus infantis]TYS57903.1 hypothetical protein FZD47_24005 [Bacillus infantis]
MAKELKDLVHELDFELGAAGVTLTNLQDIEFLLSQLVDSMEEAAYRGEEKLYFDEHYRSVRVLFNLMRYSMIDLSKEFEVAENLKTNMFALLKQQESKEKASTTANSEGSKKIS